MKINDAPNPSMNTGSINNLLKNLLNGFSFKKKPPVLKFTRVAERLNSKENYFIRDGF